MSSSQTFKTVEAFVKHVGRDRFQKDLGHTPQVVSRAIAKDKMPAHWFLGVRGLCNDLGVMTPEHLFQWSRPAPKNKANTKQDANSISAFQGAVK